MYADKITDSMRATIDGTERRRAKQIAYNQAHGIVPTQVGLSTRGAVRTAGTYPEAIDDKVRFLEEDPVIARMSPGEIRAAADAARRRMEEAAARLAFTEAARWRDEMRALETLAGKR